MPYLVSNHNEYCIRVDVTTSIMSVARISRRRFLFVVMVGLSAVQCARILYIPNILPADGDNSFGGSILPADISSTKFFSPSLPQKNDDDQQQQPSQRSSQSPPLLGSRRNTSGTTFSEESFLYANTTYTYRYSTKLFSKQYPILRDGNNVLPSVVFGVCANAVEPTRREAIRKSWGKETPVYFMVAGDWEAVSEEFGSFGDLLFVDIPEDYRNALTPKTFSFIQFASRKAIPAISKVAGNPPIEYMFKTDDDTYTNATEMSLELQGHGRPDYYGLMRNGTGPIRTFSKNDEYGFNKWYLGRDEYPHDVFPPYAMGLGYALSQRFGDCASKAMATILPMPWEDVATGLLAEVCQVNVTPSDEDWSHVLSWEEIDAFPYDRFKNGNVMVKIQHRVHPLFFEPLSRQASLEEARKLWKQNIQKKERERRRSRRKAKTTTKFNISMLQEYQQHQQRAQQSPQLLESRRNTSGTTFSEESFIYANTTYTYRYSTKLFSKQYPILRDGNNVLPSVVFGVCANAVEPTRREAIRKSWGKETPVYFMVAGDWEAVSEEFGSFGDLLFVDIPEDYRNALTPKTFSFIQFASRKAIPAISKVAGNPPIEYMFKTDDDMYINATEMSLELQGHGRPDYYGLERNGTRPFRVLSEDDKAGTNKWYLSPEEYPRDIFPPYADGKGYALSQRFGDCASKAMATILPMPWEDVATGLLAEVCQVNVTPSDEDWSHLVTGEWPDTELEKFPYDRFKNGNVMVKIQHRVHPLFFEPLSRQASLKEAHKLLKQRERRKRRRKANATTSTTT